MSFGGSKTPAPPAPQPVTPVPQEDDPRSIDAQRKAVVAAQKQKGYSAHLLTGEYGVEEDPETKKRALMPGPSTY